jgi:hypothetical protein
MEGATGSIPVPPTIPTPMHRSGVCRNDHLTSLSFIALQDLRALMRLLFSQTGARTMRSVASMIRAGRS